LRNWACFYLGKALDPADSFASDSPLLYDAKDLTTHALLVGMTGSGKTGLAISLLEEAALDGIPAILIAPKGDLANILLQFPDSARATSGPGWTRQRPRACSS
jgi:DNA helicase HerA-like ATPase